MFFTFLRQLSIIFNENCRVFHDSLPKFICFLWSFDKIFMFDFLKYENVVFFAIVYINSHVFRNPLLKFVFYFKIFWQKKHCFLSSFDENCDSLIKLTYHCVLLGNSCLFCNLLKKFMFFFMIFRQNWRFYSHDWLTFFKTYL